VEYVDFFCQTVSLPLLCTFVKMLSAVTPWAGTTTAELLAPTPHVTDAFSQDGLVKTSKLLAAVIPALDNNTQGQATAGIQ
jgi:hypothetical protein